MDGSWALESQGDQALYIWSHSMFHGFPLRQAQIARKPGFLVMSQPWLYTLYTDNYPPVMIPRLLSIGLIYQTP